MSLKPAKKSDQKKQEELRSKMQKRKQKDTPSFPPCTYIATEGTKTEPNYLRGLVRQINQRYKPYTQDAIRRAKAQYQSYGDIAPSKRVPATRVFQLVEELQAYL